MGHLAAGMGAEAAACVIFVPVDVIKVRGRYLRYPGALGTCVPCIWIYRDIDGLQRIR